MKKKFLITLIVLFVILSVQATFIIERACAESPFGNQTNSTTDVPFSERTPDVIYLEYVGYDDPYKGALPMRSSMGQNILYGWNYCLTVMDYGDPMERGVREKKIDYFPMWFMSKGISDRPGDDPTPWVEDGFQKHISAIEASRIQQKLGYVFCYYGIVTQGDIFPLTNQLYYINNFQTATKVTPNNVQGLPPMEIKGLCVPLTAESTNEVACMADFSYLPGLNFFVSRIYLVPSKDPPLYVARICSSKNVLDVSQFSDAYDADFAGRPRLKEEPVGFMPVLPTKKESRPFPIEMEKEQMEIQEVTIGDIIKGDKIGYRVLNVVPPDPCAWRKFYDKPIEAPNDLKGRLIGWVEIDPKPIPLDEHGDPVEEK